jgi:hypothetical protein
MSKREGATPDIWGASAKAEEPMSGLSRLVLRLGRNPEAGFPDGDDHHGYVVVAPLTADGFLDPELWRKEKDKCTVRRFRQGEPAADGWLRHRGADWSFWYDEEDEGPEEPAFKLAAHRLAPGEYVTIREGGGPAMVFRVAEAAWV